MRGHRAWVIALSVGTGLLLGTWPATGAYAQRADAALDAGVADAGTTLAPDPTPSDAGPPRADAAPPSRQAADAATGDGAPQKEASHDAHGSGDGPRLDGGAASAQQRIRYFVERVEVEGNTRTRARVIRHFVPLEQGDVLDVDDPQIEAIRWRLLGTGWFDDVHLRLRRGSRRGWVVLVVEVEERNTLLIKRLLLGVSEGVNRRGMDTDLEPYGGISLAETNLLGLGITLEATVLASGPQQGAELRFADPTAFGSDFLLSSSVFFNNAREFFGKDPLVTIRCPPDEEECPPEVKAKNAVVLYRRGGINLGTGHDLGASTRYTLEWQGELVDVRARPDAASEARGSEVRPIDFSIQDGLSLVSLFTLGLVYDRRDDPALPTKGVLARFRGDLGSRIFGSDYDFLRLQGLVRYWLPLPSYTHYLRFGGYVGAVFGEAPFFYKYHVSDLTDLIPSRALEMELDRRPPPNILDTSITEMRSEELAARFDIEYGVHLYRAEGFLRRLTAYGSIGLYSLADIRDLQVSIPGYDGFAKVPLDLTFDIGIRADTNIGVFQFGFSSLLGFIQPDL